MKKVLVTGASGFIGRHCLPILGAKEFEVHAVATGPRSDLDVAVHWHFADLLDGYEVRVLMDAVRPTHLLHLAWYAVPGRYWTATENLDWVAASLDLLKAFANHGGSRIVIAGTCAEYDWSEGLCSENATQLAPSTLYGTCKHALRVIVDAYAAQNNLSAAWGRLFFLYGPHEYPQKLVSAIIRSLLSNERAKCTAGDQKRDFLFVQDAASAFAALLDSNLQGPVNIASGQAIAVKEVIAKTAELLSRPELIDYGALPPPPSEPSLVVADVKRLKEELRWSPSHDLTDGLLKTIDWWRGELAQL
ncbi:MAG: epimerase [Acidobacteria bacterium]|nr:MAG: epimerase [Acidobacteriota bacterium]